MAGFWSGERRAASGEPGRKLGDPEKGLGGYSQPSTVFNSGDCPSCSLSLFVGVYTRLLSPLRTVFNFFGLIRKTH